MRSVYDGVKSQVAVRPIAATGAQTSVAIDTMGYNSAMVVVENGAVTGAPTSYTVDAKVQHCATSGGSYVDISGAAITQIVADAKSAQIRLEGLGTSINRYIKVVITPAFVGGTAPAALITGKVLLGRAFKVPVGNSSTPA